MAFNVNFYNFTKRENSTKQPDVQATTYACIVRTGTGILSPTIEIEMDLSNDPSLFNYAYIPAFERYYFVEEWVFEKRLWTARLSVDPLATYRSFIGNTDLYVLRAAAEYDGSIIDNLYPTKTGSTFSSDVLTLPWASTIDYGVFILGVVCNNAHYGSLNYYAVGSEDMAGIVRSLMNDVVTSANDFDFDDASQQLQLNLIDPLQYIKSCVYIPVAIGNIPGTSGSGNVIFYNYNIPVREYKRLGATPYFEKNLSFTIPKHPQTQSRGNFVM